MVVLNGEVYAIVRFVISDADGTLIKNGKLIDARTFDRMLKTLGSRHIPMVIASGRTYPELIRLFSPYENRLIYIALDGALAVGCDTLLCGFPICIADIADILLLLEHAQIRGAAFCMCDKTYLLTRDSLLAQAEKARIGDSLNVCLLPKKGAAAASESASSMFCTILPDEPIYKICLYTKRGVPCPAIPESLRIVYQSPALTELVRKDVSKRRAAEVLCEALHTEPETLLVYGDGENDRELLLYAAEAGGCAVTVYGAKHDLFSVTHYHTQNVAASVLHFLEADDAAAKQTENQNKIKERIAKLGNRY